MCGVWSEVCGVRSEIEEWVCGVRMSVRSVVGGVSVWSVE